MLVLDLRTLNVERKNTVKNRGMYWMSVGRGESLLGLKQQSEKKLIAVERQLFKHFLSASFEQSCVSKGWAALGGI